MVNRKLSLLGLLVIVVFTITTMVGCGGGSEEADTATPVSGAASLPAGLLLTASPGEATPIEQCRASVKPDDEVIVRVVVGGEVDVFVEDRALVKVIDAGIENPCLVPGHDCPTPWDYCCTPVDQLMPHRAAIKIVDANGKTLPVDLKKSGHFKEMDTLVIKGLVATGSDENNLVINAQGIFVEK
ncbi:MAG: hypothetical protein GY869_04315 [Planctomycetes bacterium]|nr:hypothetical protein [Planctomycetota bacterium]